ncbi:ABC transporter substrate-binding protein [Paenibacillus beijingensis]|uniref:ABC transporter substrate-binding protein n=1 Tax=Paenibacillus beijingensis TaxID=1126833 RepID=A0A0D5NKR7_9BACL|nr:extracellular solute-binding protein [Paenibacillus beijingensis]AJY75846.1 ABC transporter substrate-binding protein [Paenibacillus beijingensis]
MKKGWLLLLTAMLATGALAGCGGGNNGGTANETGTNTTNTTNSTSSGSNSGSGKPVTIKIFQFKVEIAEAMNRLKAEYEKEHPNVKLEIETVGGGADYGAALKAKFAAGDEPDIFNNGGNQELITWESKLEDLSDQPWVKDVIESAKEPISKDGKMYGMPIGIEGYGFLYNKDLFAKAGITTPPKTFSELEAAAQKLQDAGITPFSNGYQEWWVLGLHNFNVALANQDDPVAFAKSLSDGTGKIEGNKVFDDWAKLLDLTLKYSNKNPLTTDYNTQVTLFASGKTAMMQQGNWTQVQIDGISPNLNIGVLPMPINDDAKSGNILVGVPNNWVINNNSKVKQEAKDFLNWLVTSDAGKKYIVNDFKFIPALSTIEVSDPKVLGPIANDIMAYSKENKTLGWYFMRMPEGLGQEVGADIQAYIAKKMTKEQMLQDIQSKWTSMSSK